MKNPRPIDLLKILKNKSATKEISNKILILENQENKTILSPTLIRSCMQPDKIKKINICIYKDSDKNIIIKDANHFLEFKESDLKKMQVYTDFWEAKDPFKSSGCIPCRNCGRC